MCTLFSDFPKINVWMKKIYIEEDKEILEIAHEMLEDRNIKTRDPEERRFKT
jgi:hypothetical protein